MFNFGRNIGIFVTWLYLLFSVPVFAIIDDFETDPPGTWPSTWISSPIFSIDTTSSYSKSQSLKYSNNDPNLYSYPKYTLPLEEGKHYDIGGWIATSNLSGPGTSGAMIALEYFDINNNYLGGYYVNGPLGTTNWTHYGGTTTQPTPIGTVSGKLICYVKQGFTGNAWWDKVYVIPHSPVINSIFTDAYRNEAMTGTVNVKIGIDMQAADSSIMNIRDKNNTIIQTIQQPTSVDDQFLTFSFDCTALKSGDYALQCIVYVIDGGAEEISLDFRKPNYCYIDEHKRLIVAGKPFFPLGMYFCEIYSWQLDGYADSGFNCIMSYLRLTTAQMDLFDERDIKVIYSLKDVFYNMAGCSCPPEILSEADEEPYIENLCKDIRKHPALLAWYVNDERPLQELPRLIKRQNFMRAFDPDHPTWAVTNHLDDIRMMMPSYDVVGSDPYPIPYYNVNQTLQHTRATIDAVFKKRAVWMVTQVFSWETYRPDEPDLRAPTYAEIRAMAWEAITGGANGLILYSYFDMRREPDFTTRWQNVRALSLEIKQFIPMLLSIDPTPECQYTGSDKVSWRIHQYNGETYLFVTNGNNGPFYITFNFTRNIISIQNQIPNGSSFNIDPSSFNTTLAAYETAVYKINLAP